ncbi:MAG: pseudaminic acid cytidylyltransferase [Verrucomicrobiota bacterium]
MSAIAIIPARGGSKRIPRKNVKSFMGKPIIAYVIETALASGCFEEVMVSTDDEEIADISRSFGATIPFMRSADNSNDQAITLNVLKEVIGEYQKQQRVFEQLCCIYPTAVLSRAESLISGQTKLLSDPGAACAFPVVQYSYPIQRALYEANGRVHMFQPEHGNTRSQDLQKSYHDAGQWYWMRTAAIFEPGFTIIGPASMPVIVDEMEVQDIDNETDWRMAELKYGLRVGAI